MITYTPCAEGGRGAVGNPAYAWLGQSDSAYGPTVGRHARKSSNTTCPDLYVEKCRLCGAPLQDRY